MSSAEETDADFLTGPFKDQGPEGRSWWKGALKFIVFTTFSVSLLFLAMAIATSLNPSWGQALNQGISPYFFVLLLVFQVPQSVPLFTVLIVLFAMYAVIFGTMIYDNATTRKKDILDTPVGFLIAGASAVLLIVSIITQIETSSGTPIGGGGIDSQLQNNPLLGYMGLIYAPFVEELGFRIIPLGLYSLLLINSFHSEKYGRPPIGDALLAFIIPGKIRDKYNIKWNWLDWLLIVVTSIIFGYAHIFFGAWDWGKFIPVFITGIALAMAFMKFGAYVDIPFHWFFNGVFTVIYLDVGLTDFANLFGLWIFFVGAVSIIAILFYIRKWRRVSASSVSSA